MTLAIIGERKAAGFLCEAMTKEIRLSQEYVVLVSDHRYDELSKYNWTPQVNKNQVYAKAKMKGQTIYLHRFIMQPPDDIMIDHIDGDSLNCTDENMRFATRAQNQVNRGPNRNNPTGYKGVVMITDRNLTKRFVARITCNGVSKHLGYFDTAEQAAHAYDVAALDYFGEFAKANFDYDE